MQKLLQQTYSEMSQKWKKDEMHSNVKQYNIHLSITPPERTW